MKTNYVVLLFALLLIMTTTPAVKADVVLDSTLMTDNHFDPYSNNADATDWLYYWENCEGSPFFEYENGNQAGDWQETASWWSSHKIGKDAKFIWPPYPQIVDPGTDDSGTIHSVGSVAPSIVPEPVSIVIWTLLGAAWAGLAWHRRPGQKSPEWAEGSPTIQKGNRWSKESRRAILKVIERKKS